MSRLSKRPISIEKNVEVTITGKVIGMKGPKGSLDLNIPEDVKIESKEGFLSITTQRSDKFGKMITGTISALVKNNMCGVSKGFERKLELIGVGYRAQVKGQNLTLNLGYSHPIEYDLPKSITCNMDGNTKMSLLSCDKQLLGKVASEIRAYRPPEPYKGKGVKYAEEYIIRKAGKSGKK